MIFIERREDLVIVQRKANRKKSVGVVILLILTIHIHVLSQTENWVVSSGLIVHFDGDTSYLLLIGKEMDI